MKLQQLYENAQTFLGKDYFWHAVRHDKDLPGIMAHGLTHGTNVSTQLDGQAFEDEGATILVFRKSDYELQTKDYQNDCIVVRGAAPPVAIFKDTSIHTSEALDLDQLADEYDRLTKEFKELARVTDMTEDEIRALALRTEISRKKVVPESMTETQFQKLMRLHKQEDILFKKMEKAEASEDGKSKAVTHADVLKRYKHHNVPVLRLPKIKQK